MGILPTRIKSDTRTTKAKNNIAAAPQNHFHIPNRQQIVELTLTVGSGVGGGVGVCVGGAVRSLGTHKLFFHSQDGSFLHFFRASRSHDVWRLR